MRGDANERIQRKMAAPALAAVLLALLLGAASCATPPPPPADAYYPLGEWNGSTLVSSTYGQIRGYADDSGTIAWKGIPFAAPPVGELRWKAPRPHEPWLGVLDARSFGPASCQMVPVLGAMGSEDCLYLNVWRPATKATGLPVYLYIHGGGNTIGMASLREYAGSAVSSRSGMVYVSVSYRLGVLGWFRNPALAAGEGSAEDRSGNFGTLDLVAALRWVKDNIAAFGGDPGNVTIAGESAGAMNVFSLLATPEAKGLFQRAVAESGVSKMVSAADAEEASARLLHKLLVADGKAKDEAAAAALAGGMAPADIAAYLRAQPPRRLMSLIPPSPMGASMADWPCVIADGEVLPAGGYETFADGSWPNRVPLLIGCNKDEMKLFAFLMSKPPRGTRAYEVYTKYASLLWRASGLDSIAASMAAGPDAPPVWAYRFDWGSPDAAGASVMPGSMGRDLGAYHSAEIPFFLGMGSNSVSIMTGDAFTWRNEPGRHKLRDLIMAYLAAFARSGDPNGDDRPRWEAWPAAAGTGRGIVLDAGYDELRVGTFSDFVTKASVRARAESELGLAEFAALQEAMKGGGPFSFE